MVIHIFFLLGYLHEQPLGRDPPTYNQTFFDCKKKNCAQNWTIPYCYIISTHHSHYVSELLLGAYDWVTNKQKVPVKGCGVEYRMTFLLF